MEHYKIDILHSYRYVYLVLYISYLPIYYIYIYVRWWEIDKLVYG